MDAHERARLRAVPLVARITRRVAEHMGVSVDDLAGTLLAADIEAYVLAELADLLDPWSRDHRTPVVSERVTLPVDESGRPAVRKR
jgi:hypothetical protein